MYDSLASVSIENLKKQKIKLILLDADNTLTFDHDTKFLPGAKEWCDKARDNGMELVILSNGSVERGKVLQSILGIESHGRGKKPLPGKYKEIAKEKGLKKNECAMIGDQLFTDILGGNLSGCYSVFVEPYSRKERPVATFKVKRAIEDIMLAKKRKEFNITPNK